MTKVLSVQALIGKVPQPVTLGYRLQSCSTSSSIIRMRGQGVLSAFFPITQNQEWLIHQRVELTHRGSSTSWRNGLTGTSWSSTRNAKSYIWGGMTPGRSTSWGSTQLESKFNCGHQIEYGPAMCPVCKEGQWYPRLHYIKYCHQWRELILTLIQHWCVHTWSTLSSSGPLSTRDMGILVESPTTGYGDD